MNTNHASPQLANPSQSSPSFVQLARSPLIPERVLKRYGAYCAIDGRFRSSARLLQCLWLKRKGIQIASSDGATTPGSDRTFGSILTAEEARAGKNFLSPAIHHLAIREFLLREEDAAIDEERLFGNALSSMPMAFNLLGPLALDLELATIVFRHILPEFVQSVEQILWEHSPFRRDDRGLSDRSAFDLAVRVTTPKGEQATVFIEAKYSESMEGPAARTRERYDEVSEDSCLYRDPASAVLRSVAIEQLWREHMLASQIVREKLTSKAVFMAIGPQLNRRVQAAFRIYEAELLDADDEAGNRVGFAPVTLEAFIQAIAAAGAGELATALWDRYCDFHRVYQLSREELVGMTSPTPAQSNATLGERPSNTPTRRALPPPRRRTGPAANTSSAADREVM